MRIKDNKKVEITAKKSDGSANGQVKKQKEILKKHLTTKDRIPKIEASLNNKRKRLEFISIVNKNFGWLALTELIKSGWDITKETDKLGRTKLSKGDAAGSFGRMFVVNENIDDFMAGENYSPYRVITRLKFKGLGESTIEWFANNYDAFPDADDYIRVGNKYYKLKVSTDKDGFKREELLTRDVHIIKRDYSELFLEAIPKFDKFTLDPDNVNYKVSIEGNYNMYARMTHEPKKGSCKHSLSFIKHIFGDDHEMGLDYFQLLYEKPKQLLPVLLLLSEAKNTGKTTVLDWVKVIYGANAGIVRPEDLSSRFNANYATKNIALVDEAKFKGDEVFEKLKSLTTAKSISMEMKGVEVVEMPYWGKWIIAGNDEEGIIRMDDDEIRYWPMVLAELGTDDPDFLKDKLNPEIPAFLWFLKNRKLKTAKKMGRHWFDPKKLKTPALRVLKDNSLPNVVKDINVAVSDAIDKLQAEANEYKTLVDEAIKSERAVRVEADKKAGIKRDSNITDTSVTGFAFGSISDLERLLRGKYKWGYLKTVLKKHFDLPEGRLGSRRYRPFAERNIHDEIVTSAGRPILFIRYEDGKVTCDLMD